MAFCETQAGGLIGFQSDVLPFDKIRHVFSTRKGGVSLEYSVRGLTYDFEIALDTVSEQPVGTERVEVPATFGQIEVSTLAIAARMSYSDFSIRSFIDQLFCVLDRPPQHRVAYGLFFQ